MVWHGGSSCFWKNCVCSVAWLGELPAQIWCVPAKRSQEVVSARSYDDTAGSVKRSGKRREEGESSIWNET